MWHKIKAFLAVILIVVLMPYRVASAGACLSLICIFEMILKATPGLPVFEFAAIVPALGRLPGVAIKVVQEEFKSYLDDFQQKVMTGDFESLSLPEAPKLSELKNKFIIDEVATKMFDSFEGGVDLNNPLEIGAAMEEMYTRPIQGTIEEAQHQVKLRKQMLEGDTINTLGKVALMQKEIEDSRTQFDEVMGLIDAASDENKATKAALQSKALLAKVVAQMNELESVKQSHESYKELLLNANPSNTPALSSLAGGSGGGGNLFSSALAPLKQGSLDKVKDLKTLGDAKKKLQDAVTAHNTIFALYSNVETIEKHKRTILQHEEILESIKASDECSINRLSDFYNNPKEVWYGPNMNEEKANDYATRGGLTGWAISAYQNATANAAYQPVEPPDFAAGDPLPEGEAFDPNTTFDPDQLGQGGNDDYNPTQQTEDIEAFARISWEIGREGLFNLYNNQDEWGSKKDYFPLWEDQKSLYDQYWENNYKKIQSYFKCAYNFDVPVGPSNVSDQIKYFKQNHSQVVDKHDEFITDIFGQAVEAAIQANLDEYNDLQVITDAKNAALLTAQQTEADALLALQNAQTELQAAQVVVDAAQAEVDLANEAVANAVTPAEQAAAALALTAAEQALLAAQQAYNTVQTTVNQAQTAYASTQTATQVAQTAFNTAQAASQAAQNQYQTSLANQNALANAPASQLESMMASMFPVLPPAERPAGCPVDLATIGQNYDPPITPPNALPPFNEIVMLDDRDMADGNLIPYPEMPEPWQQFVEIIAGGKPYGDSSQPVLTGEFGQVYKFSGSGAGFKVSAEKQGSDGEKYDVYEVCLGVFGLNNPDGRNCLISNRIGKLLVLRSQEIEMNKARIEAEIALDEIKATVKEELANAGFVPPENFDITKQEDFDLAIERLSTHKAEVIADVESDISQIDLSIPVFGNRANLIKKLVLALKKDTEGLLNISDAIINATDLDDRIAQAMADRMAIVQFAAVAAQEDENMFFDTGCTLL